MSDQITTSRSFIGVPFARGRARQGTRSASASLLAFARRRSLGIGASSQVSVEAPDPDDRAYALVASGAIRNRSKRRNNKAVYCSEQLPQWGGQVRRGVRRLMRLRSSALQGEQARGSRRADADQVLLLGPIECKEPLAPKPSFLLREPSAGVQA